MECKMQLSNYYYWFKSVISPEDCQRIIDLGESVLQKEKELGRSTEGYTFGDQEKGAKPNAVPINDGTLFEASNENKDTYVRDSEVAWLRDQSIYDLVVPVIDEANKRAGWNWQYDYHEQFQFTKYNKGGFYGWHKDGASDTVGAYKRYIPGITEHSMREDGRYPPGYTLDHGMVGKVRKISMTLNLNPPGQYEGGDLKFDFGMHTDREARFHLCEEIRPQGSMIIFPSFVDHCVTPVTSGTRYSLVLWTLGDPWK
jgi:PKHD-type hydroxylase